MDSIGLVVLVIGLFVAVPVIAYARGRNGFLWLILAFFITPIIALIILVAIPVKKDESDLPNPNSHVKCPDCKELVLKEARVCKHCGCKLIPQA